jgi:hypothetical protein
MAQDQRERWRIARLRSPSQTGGTEKWALIPSISLSLSLLFSARPGERVYYKIRDTRSQILYV